MEIDKNLIPILQDTLKDYDNVTVINNDILKVDIRKMADEKNQGRPIKVVANLPYYITTPIIMGLFENHVPVESITVMVQKEVAALWKSLVSFQYLAVMGNVDGVDVIHEGNEMRIAHANVSAFEDSSVGFEY